MLRGSRVAHLSRTAGGCPRGGAGIPDGGSDRTGARSRRGRSRHTEAQLRAAWADPVRTRIDLGADIVLRDCFLGDPIRETPYPMVLDGHGYAITQACFEKRLLRQDGTGFLDIRDVTLTRGGSDGPGAALTSRGEILLSDCLIRQNLAEEPGGGVFSMRRVTVHRCYINGNLANDDGGGIYARRGGVEVYDSVLSTNLVDGSGGAIGSTGDILVVRSFIDGNTTDGDGGALYADEDGDVTVIDSFIDGSDADGPGGAIFTLDGDVAVLDSTLNGNRADDRGGAISGEADVLVVNSTVARNLAVAHAGGGIWARGDLVLMNSTVTDNYAEGEGGGVLAAGRLTLLSSTVVNNIASIGGNIGASGGFRSFATILGPPVTTGVTGDTIPTSRSCRVHQPVSVGYNFLTDETCLVDDSGIRTCAARTRCSRARGRHQRVRDGPAARQPGGGPDPQRILPGHPARPAPGRSAARRVRRLGPDPGPRPDRVACATPGDRATSARSRRPSPDQDGDRPPGPPADAVAPRRGRGPGSSGRRRGSPSNVPGCGPAAPSPGAGPARAEAGAAQPPRPALRRTARLHPPLPGPPARRRPAPLGVPLRRTRRHRRGPPPRPRTPSAGRPPWMGPAPHVDSRRCLSLPVDPNGTGEDARTVARRSRPPRSPVAMAAPAGASRRAGRRPDREVRRLGVLPDSGAADRGRRRPAGPRLPGRTGRPGQRAPAPTGPGHRRAASGTTPTTSCWRSVRRTARSDPAPAAPTRARASTVAIPASAGRRDRGPTCARTWRALREDVEDLGEPVAEITQFDECLYTVGVRGAVRLPLPRPGTAASAAVRPCPSTCAATAAPMSLMVFPGEEPPQIECNEDASGQSTDE